MQILRVNEFMKKILVGFMVGWLFLGGYLMLSNKILAQGAGGGAGAANPLNKAQFTGLNIQGGGETKSVSDFIQKDERLIAVWKAMLALVNIVVVLILIGVAFATIFHVQVDTYGIKKVLPTLIIGVVLANLSMLISRNLVDFAGVVSANFINAVRDPVTGASGKDAFVKALSESIVGGGLSKLGDLANSSTTAQIGTGAALSGLVIAGIVLSFTGFLGIVLIAALILAGVLFLIPALLFTILAFLLYARMVILIFLTAISPLAFMGIAFAPTQSMFKQWWTQFLRWNFMAPIVFFFLWLAVEFQGVSGTGSFASYALAMIMLYLAIQVPFKLGGAVMGVWGGFGKKAASTLGKKAWNYGNSLLERKGWISPRAAVGSWQDRMRDMEEENLAMAKGKGRETMARYLGSGRLPLWKTLWTKEGQGLRDKEAQIQKTVNARNLYRKQFGPFAGDPDLLVKALEARGLTKDEDARAVVAEMIAKSGAASGKNMQESAQGIMAAAEASNNEQVKEQAKNDIAQLLRQILTTIRSQRDGAKQYDLALPMALAKVAMEQNISPSLIDINSYDNTKRQLEEHDRNNGTNKAGELKEGIVKELELSYESLKNLSPAAQQEFSKLFGEDWQDQIKTIAGSSVGVRPVPPPQFNINQSIGHGISPKALEVVNNLWQNPTTNFNADVAIHGPGALELVKQHVMAEFNTLPDIKSKIGGIDVEDFNLDKVKQAIESVPQAQQGNAMEILVRLAAEPKSVEKTLEAIRESMKKEEFLVERKLRDANADGLEAFSKALTDARKKLRDLELGAQGASETKIVNEIKEKIEQFVSKQFSDSIGMKVGQPDELNNAFNEIDQLIQGYQKI